MTAKEYLSRPAKIKKDLKEMKDVMQRYMDKSIQISSMLTEMPHNPNRDISKVEAYTVLRIDMEEKFFKKMDEYKSVVADVSAIIEKVPKETHRRLLRYRYLEEMTISEIADIMDYSGRHTKRLHKEALEEINSLL